MRDSALQTCLAVFLCICVGLVFVQADVLVLLREAAQQKGAACLDGSPGGYYFRAGTGVGAKKWIVHFEGGGWCFDHDNCVARSKTDLGSSKNWTKTATFGGLLSADAQANPDFYNWNVAFMKYCDGAAFSGNVTMPVVFKGTTLYYRGIRIAQAIMEDLMSRGMHSATDTIVTGCSAGGLATYLHADWVREWLPSTVQVKAIADAGYFLDALNWTGQSHIRPLMKSVFSMQNCSGGVNSDCIAGNQGQEWKCFFAQYTFPYIRTPLFVLNSLYDHVQLDFILQYTCKTLDTCPEKEKQAFYNYRNVFLADAKPVLSSATSGAFLPSCELHCMSLTNSYWSGLLVNGTILNQAFASWYKGSSPVHLVDCPYPCNKSCPPGGHFSAH